MTAERQDVVDEVLTEAGDGVAETFPQGHAGSWDLSVGVMG